MIGWIPIAWVVDQVSILVCLLGILYIFDESLVFRPLIGPVSLHIIMIRFDGDSILRSLVFLSDELSSETKGVGLRVLVILLLLLHDIWIVGILTILVANVELVALVYALRSRCLFKRATCYKFCIRSLIGAVLKQTLLVSIIVLAIWNSHWLFLHRELHLLAHILIRHLHHMIRSQCICRRKLVIELHLN